MARKQHRRTLKICHLPFTRSCSPSTVGKKNVTGDCHVLWKRHRRRRRPPPPCPLLHSPLRVPQAWSDRHEPPALRAALRLAAASNGTAASSNVSQSTQEKKERDPTTGSLSPLVARTGSTKHDASGKGQYNDESFVFDMRLVFVSGTGLTARRRGRRAVGGLARPGDVDNDEDGKQTEGGRPPADMWRVLGRELWNPWPQADVVVHTGSQVSIRP